MPYVKELQSFKVSPFVIYVLLHLLHLLSSVNAEIISHALISFCYHQGSYRDHSLNDIKFWDSNGFLTGRDVTDQSANLHKYLWETYNATEYLESFPFLVMGCQGGPSDNPPFSVAGVIAIWRDAKDFGFMPLVGDFTQGDEIEVDDDILDQIVRWKYLQRMKSFLWTMLVVEMPLVGKEEHLERLQSLPIAVGSCVFTLRFNNGLLPNADRIRAPEVKPDPEKPFRAADHRIGDLFLVDYAAGVTQTVCNFGRRSTLGWKGDALHNVEPRNSQGEGSSNGVKYFAFDQAAFVANEREIALSCASVPLPCRNESLKRHQPQRMAAQECGMLHLPNHQLRSSNRNERLILYAVSYDPEFEEQS
ncbi:hypothetical protein NOF04DRAFT_1193982 [Fusarium oxysporum II5]|nr:hypothetical protein NOF04DRAFT_1193982 [Fusarium oxysporum II5]